MKKRQLRLDRVLLRRKRERVKGRKGSSEKCVGKWQGQKRRRLLVVVDERDASEAKNEGGWQIDVIEIVIFGSRVVHQTQTQTCG